MHRLTSYLIVFSVVLALSGCSTPVGSGSRDTSIEGQPLQGQQSSSTPEGIDAARLPDLLRERIEAGGDPKLVQNKATAVEWIAADSQNQLIVGGLVDFPEPDAKVKKASHWFRDPLVSRVIIREAFRNMAETKLTGSLSILSRQQLSRSTKPDTQNDLGLDQWQDLVDLHAERVSGFVCCSISAVQQQSLRTSVSERLGNRLLEVSFPMEPRPTVSMVVRADELSEDERVAEAVRLAALAMVSSPAQSAIIDYDGVSSVKRFVIHHTLLFRWATQSSDLKDVRNWIEVDGKRDASSSGGVLRFASKPDWSDLAGDRIRLTKLSPEDARLYVGMTNANKAKIVVLEGVAGQNVGLDDVLHTYEQAIDQIFVQGRGVGIVHVYLHKDYEVFFMEFTLDEWALRHFLMQTDQVSPSTLVETARDYAAYQKVD